MAGNNVADAETTALWLDQLPARERREPLGGDVETDVVIVGGGFSGLWTAYYLQQADPTVRILIVEKDFCGFGASGRNGGWAVGELAGSAAKYAARSSVEKVRRQERALFDSVDEIGRVSAEERIHCGFAKGGNIRLARNRPQADRQKDEIAEAYNHGLDESDLRLLGPDEAKGYLNASRVEGGIFFAHCAALNPAQLATGLASLVESRGAKIVEDTAVRSIGRSEPHRPATSGKVTSLVTDHGTIRADVVIQATEAYTAGLKGQRRALLPVYSLMIATEPLPDAVFESIGLADRPTFGDDRYMVIYGQRTADNRLAFGGRGVPYLFGSKIDPSTETHLASHQLLQETLVEMLPQVASAVITHRWGGVLGIPRDWMPGLRFDRVSGHGVLGGYVGEGVAAANLAGRTMADLVVGEVTERTTLPWVGIKSRKWEPEPFRWLGVRSSRRVLVAADDREYNTDAEAKLAFRISRLLRGA